MSTPIGPTGPIEATPLPAPGPSGPTGSSGIRGLKDLKNRIIQEFGKEEGEKKYAQFFKLMVKSFMDITKQAIDRAKKAAKEMREAGKD